MSSHHFVKEGQEPALIIIDALALELAEPLLEWVPLVVVVDNVLEDVKRWGIKIDVVIQSVLEPEQISELLSDQFPLLIIAGKPQDSSIVTALNYCISTKQGAVNLLMNPSPERFKLLEAFAHLNINVITQHEKWLLCRQRFEKWMPAKSLLSVQQTSHNQQISIEGLILKGSKAESTQDGPIRIQSPALFWVGDSL